MGTPKRRASSGRSKAGKLTAREVIALGGSLVLPLVLFTAYLEVSRSSLPISDTADNAAFLIVIACGLGCLWLMPASPRARFFASLAYIPILAGGLLVYEIFYICANFGCSI